MINQKHLLINVTISTKWECATESPVTTNNEAMEKTRKRLNSYAATRTIGMGGAYITYPNIYLAYTELWSADGIHLSNVGNERFLNSLQHALENIVLHVQLYIHSLVSFQNL